MNVLEDIRFEKSLPRENRGHILSKIALFLKEWRENPDLAAMRSSYSVRKVKAKTLLKEVWKFRVHEGSRVLFTKGESLGLEEDEAIVLLRYCNHDEQINKAKGLGLAPVKEVHEDIEALVEEVADGVAQHLDYDLETSITRVFKHIGIEELINLEGLQGIFYLNEEQRYCVNADYRPLVLFGSAGSGKTTIGVYKLIDLLSQNPGIKVGYFTYSKKLAQSAEKIFQTVLKNEKGTLSAENYRSQVDFYPLKEWLRESTGVQSIINFESFYEAFYYTLRQNLSMHPEYKKVILNVEAYDLWREIRGLIKGFAGEAWKPNVEAGGMLSLEEYLSLSSSYSSFDKEERTIIYNQVALKYQVWLKRHNKYDENDLSRIILRQPQKQYDWIVIDEVQDLTELEIYLLHTMVKTPGNFLLSGDYHQTIAPTYFSTKRIMSLLEHQQFRYKDDSNQITLAYNYRNPKQVVHLANQLSSLRENVFGKDKRHDYGQEISRVKEAGRLYTLCEQPKEKMKLLQEAAQKAYVYVVVATEKEKEALQKQLEDSIRVFTIYEVKGLENKYVIGLNLISHFKEKWQTILDYETGGMVLEESHFYRYLINILYVALTRAQETLCLIEDEVTPEFIQKLLKTTMHHKKVYDPMAFSLEEQSSLEDFFKEARKYEEAEDYQRAIAQYKKLDLPQAPLRINICHGKIAEESGHYKEAGDFYKKGQELEAALRCYKKGRAYEQYYKLLMNYNEEQFIEEVLLNPEVDYKRDLKPYFKGPQQKQLENLCMRLYDRQLMEIDEDLELGLLYLEEIQETIQILNENLKGVTYERPTYGGAISQPETTAG